jgi:hypothetical protein
MSAVPPANNDAGPRGNGPSTTPSESVRKRLAELKTLRDRVRVELNLAGKEARDRWHRIEERIRAAQERVRRSEGVRALGPLIESVKRFNASLRRKSKSA